MDVMIIGAGGHGRGIADALEKQGSHTIAGFVDDRIPFGQEDYGYSVIGSIDDIERLAKDIPGGIIAVGDNWIRGEIAQRIRARVPNFIFVQAIHPGACIARGTRIGDGAAILAGALIASDCVIGNHTIVFMGALMGHDSILGDYASLGPMSGLCGNSKAGMFTSIGAGATVIHKIDIGANTVIGAGSTVVSDIPERVVAYGSPAKVQKARNASDRYL